MALHVHVKLGGGVRKLKGAIGIQGMEARQGHKRDLSGSQAHSKRGRTPCPQGFKQGSHNQIRREC